MPQDSQGGLPNSQGHIDTVPTYTTTTLHQKAQSSPLYWFPSFKWVLLTKEEAPKPQRLWPMSVIKISNKPECTDKLPPCFFLGQSVSPLHGNALIPFQWLSKAALASRLISFKQSGLGRILIQDWTFPAAIRLRKGSMLLAGKRNGFPPHPHVRFKSLKH